MSKISIYISVTSGTLVVFADLPIFFLFGVVFVGVMIELKKIEKKIYPVISNILLSSIFGWAFSFAGEELIPKWFEGNVRIFSMLITTLFAYATVLYVLKNETIQKAFEKWFKKKIDK